MELFYPVKLLADWITYSLLKAKVGSLQAEAANFFIFDTIKIFILLTVVIFIASFIRSYLPPEKIKSVLARKHLWVGNILAAIFGIFTPFCSCSAVPLFMGFVEAGVPLGITFSFLIASPMINEVALVMLFGMFGFKVALVYVASGFLIAVFSGIILGKIGLEHLVKDLETKRPCKACECSVEEVATTEEETETFAQRVDYAWWFTKNTLNRVWLYVMLGIGLGAWIHGYVPVDFLASYAGSDKWYAVLLATVIGIPLYSNAAGVLPLVSVLTEKGVAIGTALAFMMATTGLSLPEFIILKKVMKTKLIVIFTTVVGLGILFTGYLFNWILG
jgi:hypothetical protein